MSDLLKLAARHRRGTRHLPPLQSSPPRPPTTPPRVRRVVPDLCRGSWPLSAYHMRCRCLYTLKLRNESIRSRSGRFLVRNAGQLLVELVDRAPVANAKCWAGGGRISRRCPPNSPTPRNLLRRARPAREREWRRRGGERAGEGGGASLASHGDPPVWATRRIGDDDARADGCAPTADGKRGRCAFRWRTLARAREGQSRIPQPRRPIPDEPAASVAAEVPVAFLRPGRGRRGRQGVL